MTTLHVRLYVGDDLIVDDDVDTDNAFDRAEAHARRALADGRPWRLEFTDPDGIAPTIHINHRGDLELG